jgi:hypothetical protein
MSAAHASGMKRIWMTAIAIAVATPAHADKAKDIAKLGQDLVKYADYTGPVGGENGDGLRDRKKKTECPKIVAAAAKTLSPDDDVKSWSFARHPKQKDNVVKVADLGWFCDEYIRTIDRALLAEVARTGLSAKKSLDEGLNDTQKKGVERFQIEHLEKVAKECKVLVDAAKAGGMPADAKIRALIRDVRFDEMPGLCDAIEQHVVQLKPVFAEKFEKAAAVYKAVGIGGKRLELFAYYHPMEWYFAGCKTSTDDPKKLKAARALFQWLTGPDGITVRKYSFSGDNYTISEKQFVTEAAAYSGCR